MDFFFFFFYLNQVECSFDDPLQDIWGFFCFSTNYLKSLRRWMNRLGMVRQSGVDFNIKMTSSSYVIYIYLLGTRIYIIPFFLLTIHGQHLENDYYIHQITSK